MRFQNFLLILITTYFLQILAWGSGDAKIFDCETQWSEQKIAGQYSFASDVEQSSLGNIGYEKYFKRLNRSECLKDWTILIYMAADNNLSPYALWDIDEIEKQVAGAKNRGASTVRQDVLIELDTWGKSEGRRRLHLFQTEQAFDLALNLDGYKSKKATDILSPIVEFFPEANETLSVTPVALGREKFERFLEWGMLKYPSKHYMVIVWGHGEGFIGKSLTASGISAKLFGGVAMDNSDGSYLTIPDIKDALNIVRQQRKLKQPIDVLAFDACLMQSLEVATELHAEVNYLLGSMQIQNYLGLPYRALLDELHDSPSENQFIKSLTSLVEESFSEGLNSRHDPAAHKSMTMSLLSLGPLINEFLPKFRGFAQALIDYQVEDPFRLMDIRLLLARLPAFKGETRDLGVFLGALEKLILQQQDQGKEMTLAMGTLRESIIDLWRSMWDVILANVYGPDYIPDPARAGISLYDLNNFEGVSLWIPSGQKLFDLRRSEFYSSQFFQAGIALNQTNPWSQWLETLYTQPL